MAIDHRPSPNHGDRRDDLTPDILLLHYTAMETAEAAIEWLCMPASEVSCHYLVDEDGQVVQMVAEDRRAWHAGAGHWSGECDINSRSIGIEIQNAGPAGGHPDFPDIQMRSVEALCLEILSRHPIPPQRVLAHSDVSPGRKIDPGPKFDWARLHRAGIGHWVAPAAMAEGATLSPGDEGGEVTELQTALAAYGYGLETSGIYDEATQTVVEAFQLHFRQTKIDGVADRSTRETLMALQAALTAAPAST